MACSQGTGALSRLARLAHDQEDAMSCSPPTADERWIDCTAELRAAAEGLRLGEVVSSEGFSLFDSMSAVELMSPKMDSGMCADRYVPVLDRVERGELPVPPRTATEAIEVLDRLLAMELAWYDGHSLPQTVFTCLYLHPDVKPMLLACAAPLLPGATDAAAALATGGQDRALLALTTHALCTAVVQTARSLRDMVLQIDLFEEEDFSPHDFGLNLSVGMPPKELMLLLKHTEGLLSSRAELLRGEDDKSEVLTVDSCLGLAARIRLRRTYLLAHMLLGEKELAGFERARSVLDLCLATLDTARCTALPDVPPTPEQAAAAQAKKSGERGSREIPLPSPLPLGFDPFVNHALLAPNPPRELPDMLTHAKTYDEFRRVLCDLRVLCEIVELSDLHELFLFVAAFSARGPNIVVRSRLVSTLYSDAHLVLGRFKYEDLLRSNMRDFGVEDKTLDTDDGRAFVERAVKPTYDVLRVLSTNRARLRRRLVHLFEDWAVLQAEGDYIDEKVYFQNRTTPRTLPPQGASLSETYPGLHHCLGGWGMEWSLRLMLLHLLLGFELELYATHEIEAVLWYFDFLLSNAQQNRKTIELHVVERRERLREQQLAAAAASGSKGGKKKGKKKGKRGGGGNRGGGGTTSKNVSAGRPTRPPLVAREQYLLELRKQLVRGLRHFLASRRTTDSADGSGAADEIHVTPPLESAVFDDPALRFAHRFAPYSAFSQPPPLSYSDFEAAAKPSAKYCSVDLMRASEECFGRAKDMLRELLRVTELTPVLPWPVLRSEGQAGKRGGSEKVQEDLILPELKALSRVAVANSVALMKFKVSGGGTSASKPKFSFAYAFPVIES